MPVKKTLKKSVKKGCGKPSRLRYFRAPPSIPFGGQRPLHRICFIKNSQMPLGAAHSLCLGNKRAGICNSHIIFRFERRSGQKLQIKSA